MRKKLENFLSDAQKKSGYEFVMTPHIGAKELYVTSGHWDKYGADSFQPIKTPNEGEEFMLKLPASLRILQNVLADLCKTIVQLCRFHNGVDSSSVLT